MASSIGNKGQIFVLDDQASARELLSQALGDEGYEVICFADSAGLLSSGRVQMPLCVLIDCGDCDQPRLDIVERLCAEGWRVPIFVTSAKGSIAMAVEAIQKGAFDFIEKPFDRHGIVERIKAAVGEVTSAPPSIPLPFRYGARLSVREAEVLEAIAFGETTKETARRLGLSARTVEGYRANIMRKTGARNSADLVLRVLAQNDCR
jgi:FixJ family two-component response regulator